MPTSDIRNFIAFAHGLADASGAIIREAASRNNAFLSKGDDSPVTEIDRGVTLIESLVAKDGATPESALRSFCLVALNLNEFLYVD